MAVVAGFALVLALQWAAITRQSLTGDGGHHLVAGYQALRYGQNLANLEHPPLVKLIAAAPMLLERDPVQPPIVVRQWREALTALHLSPALVHRVTVRARAVLVVAIMLPLLAACVALGRRFAGPRAGWLLGLSVGLTFCVLPNLAIPETDAACTLAAVLVVLAADRYLEHPSWWQALTLGAALGLGLVSKFSAVLLAPAVGVTLLVAPELRANWRRRLGHALMIAAVCLAAVEIVYAAANWRYDCAAGREVIQTYCRNESNSLLVGDRLAWAEGPLLALESIDPRLAQWSLGLLGLQAQDALGIYPCYAFGTVTSHGRWWYFPVLLAVKLPIAVLVALLATAAVVLRTVRHTGWDPPERGAGCRG